MKRRTIHTARDAQWAIAGIRDLRAQGVSPDVVSADMLLAYAQSVARCYGYGRWRWLRYRQTRREPRSCN